MIRAAKYLAFLGVITMDGVYAASQSGTGAAIAMDGVYAGNLSEASSAIAMDTVHSASQPKTGAVSAEPVHMQLRWHHQFQFAGYYAAIEKGYYQKAGLEVILHEGAPGKTPVQEVLQGRAQYGEANSELLLERLRGAPLVAPASIIIPQNYWRAKTPAF